MNNSKSRKYELNMVVGINGTGKTHFLKNEITQKLHPDKALILTPDYAEWREVEEIKTPLQIRDFSGIKRMIYESPDDLENIKSNFSGGALILDDAMAYLNEQTPSTLQYLYIRRRQFGIDLYIVAHGLRQLPPKVFTFGSWLFLFNSAENFSARKKELIPEIYDKIIDSQRRINQKVSSGHPYYYEIILLDQQIKGVYEQQRKNIR